MQSYQLNEWGTPLQLKIRETPRPTGEEVLVAVVAAGVCHSDVHIREGFFDLGGGRKARLADSGAQLPMTLGHEISGTVAAVGRAVTNLAVGERVVVYPWIGCGRCRHCHAEHDMDCETPRSLGVRRDGGFSDHVLVPSARYLVPVGDVDLSFAATLACSGLTAFGALKKLPPLTADDQILVIGAGGVGLAAVAIAPLVTSAGVVVADLAEDRIAAARRLGARAGVKLAAGEPVSSVRDRVSAPIAGVIDFVGSPETASLAVSLVGKGGTVIVVGMSGGSIDISLPLLSTRNLTLRGSYVGSIGELRDLVRFTQDGRLPMLPISVKPMSLINQIIDDLENRKVLGRVVTTPDVPTAAVA